MKRLLMALIWLPAALMTLGASFAFFHYRSSFVQKELEIRRKIQNSLTNYKASQIYQSLPQVLGLAVIASNTQDSSYTIVRHYLEIFKSPMTNDAEALIQASREYDIDPYLLVAIAQCETNLGKKSPENCFNPFGLGIYTKKRLCFDDWEQSFYTMAKTMRTKYHDQGLNSPEEIMTKYCPVSIEKADGHWAKCVNRFMGELQGLEENIDL